MNREKKYIKAVTYLLVLSAAVMLGAGYAYSLEGGEELAKKKIELKVPERVSVHDPSVIKADNGEYYIFGSHLAGAKSKDLVNWTSLGSDCGNVTDNWIYGNVKENLAESFLWAGYDDGDCPGGKIPGS